MSTVVVDKDGDEEDDGPPPLQPVELPTSSSSQSSSNNHSRRRNLAEMQSSSSTMGSGVPPLSRMPQRSRARIAAAQMIRRSRVNYQPRMRGIHAYHAHPFAHQPPRRGHPAGANAAAAAAAARPGHPLAPPPHAVTPNMYGHPRRMIAAGFARGGRSRINTPPVHPRMMRRMGHPMGVGYAHHHPPPPPAGMSHPRRAGMTGSQRASGVPGMYPGMASHHPASLHHRPSPASRLYAPIPQHRKAPSSTGSNSSTNSMSSRRLRASSSSAMNGSGNNLSQKSLSPMPVDMEEPSTIRSNGDGTLHPLIKRAMMEKRRRADEELRDRRLAGKKERSLDNHNDSSDDGPDGSSDNEQGWIDKHVLIGTVIAPLFGSLENSAFVSETGMPLTMTLDVKKEGIICAVPAERTIGFRTARMMSDGAVGDGSTRVGKLEAKLGRVLAASMRNGSVRVRGRVHSSAVNPKLARLMSKKSMFVRNVELDIECRVNSEDIWPLIESATIDKIRESWKNRSLILEYYCAFKKEFDFDELKQDFLDAIELRMNGIGNNGNDEESKMNEMEAKAKSDFVKVLSDSVLSAEDLDGEDASALVKTSLKQHQRVGLEWMMARERKVPEIWAEMRKNDEDVLRKNDIAEDKYLFDSDRYGSSLSRDRRRMKRGFVDRNNGSLMNNTKRRMRIGDGISSNSNRESSLPPFFIEEEDEENGETYFLNILSKEKITDPNKLPSIAAGGILADDMGLGKTLQMLSLIVSSHWDLDGPTLIIAPTSVMGNWTAQIKEHLDMTKLSYVEYHSSQRDNNPEHLREYDIIITTYGVVNSEFNGETDDDRENVAICFGGFGLQYVKFVRVILDEAHDIRNRNSKKFKACMSLQCASRWALTGTPVQNKLSDLYSLFKFLRIYPISDYNFYKKYIEDDIATTEGRDRLRILMMQICLRRMKSQHIAGKKIVDLPEKNINDLSLEFTNEEDYKYRQLSSVYKQTFKEMERRDQVMKQYTSVLSMLLRLRQCCDHFALIPPEVFAAMRRGHHRMGPKTTTMMDDENGENGENGQNGATQKNDSSSLIAGLDDDDLEELKASEDQCTDCEQEMDGLCKKGRVCGHGYCLDCFEHNLNESENGRTFRCVFIDCKEILSEKAVEEQVIGGEVGNNSSNDTSSSTISSTVIGRTSNNNNNNPKKAKRKKRREDLQNYMGPQGSKIGALITDIKLHQSEDKSVVFSQWTTMLDVMAGCFKNASIIFERVDGSMQRDKRERAMDQFKKDPKIRVLLMSLKAGNLGLNLTVANRVYLMDLWWNPATEDQAIDRVYRLGQKKEVFVTRYFIRGSVEEKILEIQREKRDLMERALGGVGPDNATSRKRKREELIANLKRIFK